MEKQGFQLKRQLHFYFFRVLLVAVVIISVVFMTYYSIRETAMVIQNKRWMLDQSVTYADRIMAEVTTVGESIWTSPQIQGIGAGNREQRDYQYFRACMEYLSSMNASAENIYRIRVFHMDTKALLTSQNGIFYDVPEPSVLFYQRYLERMEDSVWVMNFNDGFLPVDHGERLVYYVRPIYSIVDGSKSGVICIEIPQTVFLTLMKQQETGDGFTIIGETVEISALSLTENDVGYLRTGSALNRPDFRFRSGNRSYTAVYQRSPYSSWQFYLYYPSNGHFIDCSIFAMVILLLFAIQITAYALIVRVFRRRVDEPIALLLDVMMTFERGDFGVQIERTNHDVFDEIYRHFNHMSLRTKELVNELIVERLRLKDGNLKMLQSQIKPHFLYNIFNSMIWMTEQKNYDGLEQMIYATAGYYKTSLNFGNDEICLYDNLNQLKYYAQIQEIRFPERFQCEIVFEEEILSLFIPNLLLQPLLENAITHGTDGNSKRTQICIHGYREEDLLVFNIRDDGVGIEPERLARIQAALTEQDYQEDDFFALANVAQRIRIYYHGKGSILIDSCYGAWTQVEIRLAERESECLK